MWKSITYESTCVDHSKFNTVSDLEPANVKFVLMEEELS